MTSGETTARHTLNWGTKTRQILLSEDSTQRRQRVKQLVRTYQPVMEETALWALRKFGHKNATLDASQVTGKEMEKMLSPDSDYFDSYDPNRRLRPWIKACIRHRVIDLLRKKAHVELDWEESHSGLSKFIDERELFEVFRRALQIAERLCKQRDRKEDMDIFRAVKSKEGYVPPAKRRERGWTEWQERTSVSRVWDLIRDEALPAAAEAVSETPEDAAANARDLWDKLRKFKKLDLPEGGDDGME